MRLEKFRASPPLDETAFELFDSTSRVIRRKSHYQWNHAPIELINEMVMQSLTIAQPFSSGVKVVPEGTPAEFAISGEVTTMKIVEADGDPRRVYVSMHVRVARTAVSQESGAPVFERNYLAVNEVQDGCLKQVPNALEHTVTFIIDSLIEDLCNSLVLPPKYLSLLAVSAAKCRENCAFRFTACEPGAPTSASTGCLGMDILDVDGDIRRHIGLSGIIHVNDADYIARATGIDTGLTVTLSIFTRKHQNYLRMTGLLGGPTEIVLANDIMEVKEWMNAHTVMKK